MHDKERQGREILRHVKGQRPSLGDGREARSHQTQEEGPGGQQTPVGGYVWKHGRGAHRDHGVQAWAQGRVHHGNHAAQGKPHRAQPRVTLTAHVAHHRLHVLERTRQTQLEGSAACSMAAKIEGIYIEVRGEHLRQVH